MIRVTVDGEDFEFALKRFRKEVQQSGLIRETRLRAYYTPPSAARKAKALRAKKRKR